MGDAELGPVQLSFNSQLRVEFRGATVTSDAGLLLPRELDERLGLSALIERHLIDPRTGRNRQFPLVRPLPLVYLQPPGRVRGHQRRRTAGPRSRVSDAGLARADGDQRRAHLDPPLVRNGRAGGGAEQSGPLAVQHGPGAARCHAAPRAARDPRQSPSWLKTNSG